MSYMIQIDTYILKSSCCTVNSAKGGGGGWGRERELSWHMKTKTFKKKPHD